MAIGHFNIAEFTALKAIFEAAKELGKPVIIGTSEGEAGFLGRKQAVALIKSLREEYQFPIFLNSDHTHNFGEVKKAVAAGYDAILFDGGKLPFQENIRQTRKVVKYVKSKNPKILIEGELGYIGSSSKILKKIPEGAAIKAGDLTTPEEAKKFVKATGVDLLAPAVGNIHGMFAKASNPSLNIRRIQEIKKAVKIPLVLHGGSGLKDTDFKKAIKAGINIVHISTELRFAWRKGLDKGLKGNPNEIAPYKIFPEAVKAVKTKVYNRMKLFNNLA